MYTPYILPFTASVAHLFLFFFLIQTNISNFCLFSFSLDISNVMMIDYLLCYCLTMTCSDYLYFHCCYCYYYCCCYSQYLAMNQAKVESRDSRERGSIHYLNRSQCFPAVNATLSSRGYLMVGWGEKQYCLFH
jgi:hypothetical protein